MTTFHINKNGLPVVCKINGKECAYGNYHFDTIEEAQKYSDKVSELENNILTCSMKCKNDDFIDYFSNRKDVFEVPITVRGKDLIKLMGKDASFYFDNLIISGIIFSIEEKENLVEITIFTLKGIEKFNLTQEPINRILVSKDNYFTNGYESRLRDIGVPSFKLRYSKKDLSELRNKYVRINCGDSYIDGLVSEVFYEENVGLIIVGDNGNENINLYEIKSIDIISEDKDYYGIFKASKELTSIVKNVKTPAFVQINKIYYPENKVEKYLRDVINIKMGKNIDISVYEKDWVDEILENINDYSMRALSFFDEYNKTLSNQDKQELNCTLTDEVRSYYKEIFESLKALVVSIENFDWTVFNRTQEKGIIDSLICIYENDLIFT